MQESVSPRITITNGKYSNKPVNDNFEVHKPYDPFTGTVVVKGSTASEGKYPNRNIKIKVDDPSYVSYETPTTKTVTDEELIAGFSVKFRVLDAITTAVGDSKVRSLIIAGAAGVGKTYGVHKILGQQSTTVKGSISAVGLYSLLYDNRHKGSIVILDDADSIFQDIEGLNLIKAATDSTESRILSWYKDSRILKDNEIPQQFEFEGSIIVITNMDFDRVGTTLKPHTDAMISRAHFVDVGINTDREKILRIQQVIGLGMLDEFEFADSTIVEINKWIEINQLRLRELSLRMVVKLAELVTIDEQDWQEIASVTLCR